MQGRCPTRLPVPLILPSLYLALFPELSFLLVAHLHQFGIGIGNNAAGTFSNRRNRPPGSRRYTASTGNLRQTVTDLITDSAWRRLQPQPFNMRLRTINRQRFNQTVAKRSAWRSLLVPALHIREPPASALGNERQRDTATIYRLGKRHGWIV